MTLDQRLTTAARQVADSVRPPAVDPDEIRTRARRSQRRRVSLVATAALVAVVAASAVLVSTPDPRTSAPVDPAPSPSRTLTSEPTPEPNPFPRSMPPEEVVAHPGALLSTVAIAPDHPGTRMSVWSVSCTRSCPGHGPYSFSAVALTSDGYETATYVRPGFITGVDLHVSSPREGLVLVVDIGNGREWLVDLDGTVRPVTRVFEEFSPDDPRLWFQCTGRWRQTWCALDPTTATAYEWPRAWDGSAARPDSGDRPWGANPEPRSTSATGRLEAWWDTAGGRQVRTLAEVTKGDYVLGSPPGEMSLWAREDGYSLDFYTSRDGGTSWEKVTRAADDLPSGDLQVTRAPSGTYFLYTTYPRLQVWRAEAFGGAFREVYQQPELAVPETTGAGLWTQGDLVYVTGYATVAVSADDGLTWRTIQTWR